MDPITTAIVAALSAGAVSGLTESSKAAINDAYQALKDAITRKCGKKSEVIQALTALESKPDSKDRQETLQEEITAVSAEQNADVLAAAKRLLALTEKGKFTVQNNGTVQGQIIGDGNVVTQQFGELPKA